VLLTIDNGALVDLTGPDQDCRQPNWSPDGKWIIYQEHLRRSWALCLYDVGAKTHRKLDIPGEGTDATFSPDSKFVLYSGEHDDHDGVLALRPDRRRQAAAADAWRSLPRRAELVARREVDRVRNVAERPGRRSRHEAGRHARKPRIARFSLALNRQPAPTCRGSEYLCIPPPVMLPRVALHRVVGANHVLVEAHVRRRPHLRRHAAAGGRRANTGDGSSRSVFCCLW